MGSSVLSGRMSAAGAWLVSGEWVDNLSKQILEESTKGWNPTVALPAGSKHVTDDWPLASLDAALTIDAAYLLFVLVGSIVMYFLPAVPDRLLYPLKFVYNLTQMFLCGYMSIESLMLKNRNNYTLFPVEKHNPFNAVAPPLANLLWLFYISKALDFVDTFTIVLQKRWNQLSFLHVLSPFEHLPVLLAPPPPWLRRGHFPHHHTERCDPRHNVHLLLCLDAHQGHLVEEIPHSDADGPVLHYDCPGWPAAPQRRKRFCPEDHSGLHSIHLFDVGSLHAILPLKLRGQEET